MESAATHPATTEDERSLCQRIIRLCSDINAAEYQLIKLMGELDSRFPRPDFTRSTAHWLSWYCGIDLHTAREKVRVAHALLDLPRIDAAFRDGELSYSKVRAMTRVATADVELTWLHMARNASAAQLDKVCSHYRQSQVLNVDGEAARQLAAEQLTYRWDDAGNLVFQGQLTGDRGALFLEAIQALVQPGGEARDEARDHTSKEEGVSKVDALVLIAERSLRLSRSEAESPVAEALNETLNETHTVCVHVPVGTLRGSGGADLPRVENGPVLAVATAQRLCCDGAVVPMVVKRLAGRTEPLSVGRKTRTVPHAIRRALKVRDGGCTFPGCHRSRYVDAHHIVHWAAGGETRLDNLVLLCRHHHRCVHEGGFRVHRDAGSVAFTDPRGRRVTAAAELEVLAYVDVGVVCADFASPVAHVPAGTRRSPLQPQFGEVRPDYDAIIGALSTSVDSS